jgi:hypothetical protein
MTPSGFRPSQFGRSEKVAMRYPKYFPTKRPPEGGRIQSRRGGSPGRVPCQLLSIEQEANARESDTTIVPVEGLAISRHAFLP